MPEEDTLGECVASHQREDLMPVETLGERIKLVRTRKFGVNQDVLGRMLGVSSMAVSKWERGDNLPTDENLRKFAEEAGVSLAWLITGESQLSGKNKEIAECLVMALAGQEPELREERDDLFELFQFLVDQSFRRFRREKGLCGIVRLKGHG